MASKVMSIGIISWEDYKARTRAIARGELKPKPTDPKVWMPSMETAAQNLNEENNKMSLAVYLTIDLYDEFGRLYETKDVWDRNITHNLGKMAQQCGLYNIMWRPEELDYEVKIARDIQLGLVRAIQYLVDHQEELEKLNPENGWGNYDNLLDFAIDYLQACLRYPNAKIIVSR